MKIGIDIDDTISNTYEVQFNLAQEYTINVLKREGSIIELDNIQTHFYTKYLHGWNDEEEKQFFNQYYKEMLMEVEPKMYAIEILRKLQQEGNEIFLVTARFDWEEVDAKQITTDWLTKYQVPYDKLITNATEKAEIIREHHMDHFVDDSFYNCEKIARLGVKTYIMDSRTNRGLRDDRITRVYSWPHLYQKLREETEWNYTN